MGGGFSAAEVLLESWGAISLLLIRMLPGVVLSIAIWVFTDGWQKVIQSPWIDGIKVGCIGFGFGTSLLLVGQKKSDPVIPAIAAAMMPIFSAIIEMMLDSRRLRPKLVAGMIFTISGG